MKHLAFNPYLPSFEYIPDGEPRVFDGRLYIYGSHDRFNGPDFCVNDYVCWSAPIDDLGDWRCEGVIYKAVQDPKNTKGRMHMNAPDCVQGTDGRYYLYYQLHELTYTSVAVAKSPAGPFAYYGAVRHKDGAPWGTKRGDTFIFDPGVLTDGDGTVWLYGGFAPTGFFKTMLKMRGNRVEGAVCLKLEPDMMSVSGGERPVVPGAEQAKGTSFQGHAFYEASSPRRIGDAYYFVYSSELSHELCYAVSQYPDRGFQYGGTIVSIGDVGYQGNKTPLNYTGNTHGGMAEINGQWYIFYHRQTNKQKCARQGCAEKISIMPDGSIPQVEMTSGGLGGGPLPGKGAYEARIACNLSGKDGSFAYLKAHEKDKAHPYFTQSGADREENGDQYIANMRDGAWCAFKYFAFDGSESQIGVKIRGDAAGSVRLLSGAHGNTIARIPVTTAEEFKTFAAPLSVEAGISALVFRYEGAGALDFKEFEIL